MREWQKTVMKVIFKAETDNFSSTEFFVEVYRKLLTFYCNQEVCTLSPFPLKAGVTGVGSWWCRSYPVKFWRKKYKKTVSRCCLPLDLFGFVPMTKVSEISWCGILDLIAHTIPLVWMVWRGKWFCIISAGMYATLFCTTFFPLQSCISEKMFYDLKEETVMRQGRSTEFWKRRERYKNYIRAGQKWLKK